LDYLSSASNTEVFWLLRYFAGIKKGSSRSPSVELVSITNLLRKHLYRQLPWPIR